MLDKHACECVSHVVHLPSCAADMPMETTSASKAVKVDSNPEIIGPDVEDDSRFCNLKDTVQLQSVHSSC